MLIEISLNIPNQSFGLFSSSSFLSHRYQHRNPELNLSWCGVGDDNKGLDYAKREIQSPLFQIGREMLEILPASTKGWVE